MESDRDAQEGAGYTEEELNQELILQGVSDVRGGREEAGVAYPADDADEYKGCLNRVEYLRRLESAYISTTAGVQKRGADEIKKEGGREGRGISDFATYLCQDDEIICTLQLLQDESPNVDT